jgi:hypothetical protein
MVKTKNTKNRILAISVASDEIPPKPNMAAMMAMMKKTRE